MKATLLKRLWLLLWLLFVGVMLSSSTWGYDAQPSYVSNGYDLRPVSSTHYDSAPVLVGNERKMPGSARRADFGQFAESLAAEGTVATQLEFDFAKGLGSAPKPVYPPNNGVLGSR
jgi:hypothetical protein